jgi:hypothetical protein
MERSAGKCVTEQVTRSWLLCVTWLRPQPAAYLPEKAGVALWPACCPNVRNTTWGSHRRYPRVSGLGLSQGEALAGHGLCRSERTCPFLESPFPSRNVRIPGTIPRTMRHRASDVILPYLGASLGAAPAEASAGWGRYDCFQKNQQKGRCVCCDTAPVYLTIIPAPNAASR